MASGPVPPGSAGDARGPDAPDVASGWTAASRRAGDRTTTDGASCTIGLRPGSIDSGATATVRRRRAVRGAADRDAARARSALVGAAEHRFEVDDRGAVDGLAGS